MPRRRRSFGAVVAALALTLSAVAEAHVAERSGPFHVSMGWSEEPAYSGAPDAVAPGALEVEVSFGQDAATTLPLVPGGTAGKLRATIIPTRPGTYGFH